MASKYEKQADKYINPLENEELAKNKKLWQQKAQDTRKYYDNQIFEAGRAYEDQYRDNAVQKAINERQVAESMANLGLTDSGLDRTQQTAVILSAANNRAAIDRARQQSIDNIELQKTGDLSTIRQGYLSDQATIRQNYDKMKTDYASSLYDTAVKAVKNSKGDDGVIKQGFILTNGSTISPSMYGTFADNNISVLAQKDEYGNVTAYKYVDNNTGKQTSIPVGTNPFTGDDNYLKYDDMSKNGLTTSEFFYDNGYQPKYIEVDGKYQKLNKEDDIDVIVNGNSQKLHSVVDKNGNTQYLVWNGRKNTYEKYGTQHKFIDSVGMPLITDNWTYKEWSEFVNGIKNSYGAELALSTGADAIKYGWIPESEKPAFRYLLKDIRESL